MPLARVKKGRGLEALGIAIDGRIPVDARLRTALPSIYACGDAIDGYRQTHAAAHEAWHAAVNALFGSFKAVTVDYSKLPWCTFTDPQVARAGHNEPSASVAGIAYEVTTYDLVERNRAVAESAAEGMVKLLTVPGKDTILGATLIGGAAGEWITGYATALNQGAGLDDILAAVHACPTFAEANRVAAGQRKKTHAPAWVLPWLARFHAWWRG